MKLIHAACAALLLASLVGCSGSEGNLSKDESMEGVLKGIDPNGTSKTDNVKKVDRSQIKN